MMSKRQAAFRADYRERISPWYHGWAHVALIYRPRRRHDLVCG
jgi:hypothetical protein